MTLPPLAKNTENDKLALLGRSEHPWTFDSKRDCEVASGVATRSEAMADASLSLRIGMTDNELKKLPFYAEDYRCIATDDPRLKRN